MSLSTGEFSGLGYNVYRINKKDLTATQHTQLEGFNKNQYAVVFNETGSEEKAPKKGVQELNDPLIKKICNQLSGTLFSSNLFWKPDGLNITIKLGDQEPLVQTLGTDCLSYIDEGVGDYSKSIVYLFSNNKRDNASILAATDAKQSLTKSVHFIDINGAESTLFQNAIQKMNAETGISVPNDDRVLLIRCVLNNVTTEAKASSRMPDAEATSAIKFAVAADHVDGQGFSASKAVASRYSPDHPLVAAVMKLSDGAPVGAVERVLDMATTSDHAVSEVEAAMAVAGSKSSEVLKHFPGGVATRMVDNDTTGAITAALAKVF